MALNDIFTMIKADKYTQDGREELIKAQQAETEDKTYKPGEISETTGKQKQPDGSWKFPKGSSAEKHQKAMENAKKVGIVKKVPSGWKKAEGVLTTPIGYVAIQNGGSRFPKEGQKKFDLKFIKQEDFEKSAATKKGTPAENVAKKRQWDAEGGPANEAERAEYDKLRSQIVYKLPDEKSSFSTDVNRMKKLKEQDPREFSVQLEKLHSKYNTNKWNDLYRKISYDSAPRELTGDCKIRIRK